MQGVGSWPRPSCPSPPQTAERRPPLGGPLSPLHGACFAGRPLPTLESISGAPWVRGPAPRSEVTAAAFIKGPQGPPSPGLCEETPQLPLQRGGPRLLCGPRLRAALAQGPGQATCTPTPAGDRRPPGAHRPREGARPARRQAPTPIPASCPASGAVAPERGQTSVPAPLRPRALAALRASAANSPPPLRLGFVSQTPPFFMPLHRSWLLETTKFLSEASKKCISFSTWELYTRTSEPLVEVGSHCCRLSRGPVRSETVLWYRVDG